MNDLVIRKVLKQELMRRHKKNKDTLILDELVVGHGAVRIDLVVLNNRLHGYEIKSDLDSLRRLPGQIRAYNSVMDRVTLVVGYRHAYNALRIVPEWWGVKLAEIRKINGTVILSSARSPRRNPEIDLNAIVALLWREEALNILEEFGPAKEMRFKPRIKIYKRLVEICKPDYLHARIRQQMKCRKGWRVDAQQTSYDG